LSLLLKTRKEEVEKRPNQRLEHEMRMMMLEVISLALFFGCVQNG
jgi:hypothetical protein